MEVLGTMSKNNLRGITLVRGPIWGIRSLTLIISCRATVHYDADEKHDYSFSETDFPCFRDSV